MSAGLCELPQGRKNTEHLFETKISRTVSTHRNISLSILSIYHAAPGDDPKMDVTGPSSWETVDIYSVSDFNSCFGFH